MLLLSRFISYSTYCRNSERSKKYYLSKIYETCKMYMSRLADVWSHRLKWGSPVDLRKAGDPALAESRRARPQLQV